MFAFLRFARVIKPLSLPSACNVVLSLVLARMVHFETIQTTRPEALVFKVRGPPSCSITVGMSYHMHTCMHACKR